MDNIEQIKQWYCNEKISRAEIAKRENITLESLKYLLQKYEIKKMRDWSDLPDFTPIQIEVINGSLLGDGGIHMSCDYEKNNKNGSFKKTQSRLSIHGESKLPYLTWHQSILLPYESKIKSRTQKAKFKFYDQKEKMLECYVFRTISHSRFTELNYKWYIKPKDKRVKIVPNDLTLTPLTLAVWFCDDGINDAKRRQAIICTDGFSFLECELLLSLLSNNLGIKARIIKYQKHPRIMVAPSSYLDFIKLIQPYFIWPCYQYKVSLANYKHPALGEFHRNSKLSLKEVEQIFELKKVGMFQSEIAKKFGVSASAVCNILQGKRWKRRLSQKSRFEKI